MTDTPSILILHGNDEYAISGHIERICAGLGDSSTAEMNIARFDGRAGLDFEGLNTAVNAAPFLAPRRVMVLEHPVSAFAPARKKAVELQELSQPPATSPQQEDEKPQPGIATTRPEEDDQPDDHRPFSRKKFIDLLDKAQPTTTIILAEYDRLKGDHWLLKYASGNPCAGVHVYNLPTHMEMPRWIESETRKLGGKIEPGAAQRLSEMVGEDPRIAAQELGKLLTYVNYARPISMGDVDKVSIASAQGNIFDLVDALGQGDGNRAQHVLHTLLEDEEVFAIWGMVIRQFRLLLQARELLDAGKSPAEVQTVLGLHPYVAPKICNQARRFSLPALETIYHKLLEIDEGAKTSQVPLDLALDLLVADLAQ
jgi:DNA polymerase-3 subunit delta